MDANLLIYAVNVDAPRHKAARIWLEKTLSGTTEVGLAWIVVLAFLRITTRSGILARPLPVEDALAVVDGWFGQPFVRAVQPGSDHWPLLRQILVDTGTGGNITYDAHLATLALECGASIYSADYDFRRFACVHHVNPLSGEEQ
ncbi:MAG: PIN domain-containing protein [Gammaproteobacteria bacterium]|nr:PIN domain-containing protein [Gammaproteobacteria bacterium]